MCINLHEEFNLGAFLFNVSFMITLPALQWSFFGHLSDMGGTAKLLSLGYSYTKMQQHQRWPNTQDAWTTVAEKLPYVQ
jgi:hypothetical protein